MFTGTMDMGQAILAQTTTDTSGAKDVVRAVGSLAMFFSLSAIAVTIGIAVFWIRDRRRLRELERLANAPAPTVAGDVWEESGRRMETPSPEQLVEGLPAAGTTAAETRAPQPRRVEAAPTPTTKPTPRAVTRDEGRPLVLVTGGARRVGRAIALRMARAGCDVMFTYHQSSEDAESLARDLADLNSTGSFYQVDLADPRAIEGLARDLAASLPRLDVLVHNASIYHPSPLADLSADDLLRNYAVNAAGPALLTARLAPLLRSSTLKGGASVIAFSDIHSMGRPRRDYLAYSMSKAAVAEMIQTLARDLAPEVRVNGIAPGVVAWPDDGHEAQPEAQLKYIRRIPLGRAGTPDDAAEAARWLAFDASYITGEIIRVDGGRWLT